MSGAQLGKIISGSFKGDLLTIFRPLEEMLNSSRSRLSFPVNLFNRSGRRVDYGLLELIVESKSSMPEWKLKLDDISITRQFKPMYDLELLDKGVYLSKFVYDITSILNIQEITSKEWININIKYEGGSPFTVKAILLDVIYDDPDADLVYEHDSGLQPLQPGESLKYHLGNRDWKHFNARLIVYPFAKSSIELVSKEERSVVQLTPGGPEEFVFTVNSPVTLEIKTPQLVGKQIPLLISSMTLYSGRVKQPLLEISRARLIKGDRTSTLVLNICNKGEASPDRLVVTILKGGVPIQTIQDQRAEIPPDMCIDKQIQLPLVESLTEIKARIIWFKLTRRWFRDQLLDFS